MNGKTWLLIDVSFLAWRAVHSMGNLSFGSVKTGVIYGFLREVVYLQERFATMNVAFCFDYGVPLRKKIYEGYKLKRHSHVNRTEEEERLRSEVRRQIALLRNEYLNTIGYRNVFAADGYEGDDIIAVLAQQVEAEGGEAIIVSADHDLFQLLSGSVSIFNPSRGGKTHTLQSFKQGLGILPKDWALVKAMTGCSTDEITGIPGVGEKTAIRHILGQLKETTVASRRIRSDKGRRRIARNEQLVRLPFKGTPSFKFSADELSVDGWKSVCKKLGMDTLHHKTPFVSRIAARASGFGFKK